MKLANTQLPRQSRETIRCSAASLMVKLSDAQLAHHSRETIRGPFDGVGPEIKTF